MKFFVCFALFLALVSLPGGHSIQSTKFMALKRSLAREDPAPVVPAMTGPVAPLAPTEAEKVQLKRIPDKKDEFVSPFIVAKLGDPIPFPPHDESAVAPVAAPAETTPTEPSNPSVVGTIPPNSPVESPCHELPEMKAEPTQNVELTANTSTGVPEPDHVIPEMKQEMQIPVVSTYGGEATVTGPVVPPPEFAPVEIVDPKAQPVVPAAPANNDFIAPEHPAEPTAPCADLQKPAEADKVVPAPLK